MITGIKSSNIDYLGIDVYKQEGNLFFQDLSNIVIQDDTFQLLQFFPNVVIPSKAFFTRNTLEGIATATLPNVTEFEQEQLLKNEVACQPLTPTKLMA